jgi:hypothetical protein
MIAAQNVVEDEVLGPRRRERREDGELGTAAWQASNVTRRMP